MGLTTSNTLIQLKKAQGETNLRLDAILAELKAIHYYLAQTHERENAPAG